MLPTRHKRGRPHEHNHQACTVVFVVVCSSGVICAAVHLLVVVGVVFILVSRSSSSFSTSASASLFSCVKAIQRKAARFPMQHLLFAIGCVGIKLFVQSAILVALSRARCQLRILSDFDSITFFFVVAPSLPPSVPPSFCVFSLFNAENDFRFVTGVCEINARGLDYTNEIIEAPTPEVQCWFVRRRALRLQNKRPFRAYCHAHLLHQH